jgi:hypothetical protein
MSIQYLPRKSVTELDTSLKNWFRPHGLAQFQFTGVRKIQSLTFSTHDAFLTCPLRMIWRTFSTRWNALWRKTQVCARISFRCRHLYRRPSHTWGVYVLTIFTKSPLGFHIFAQHNHHARRRIGGCMISRRLFKG